MYIPTKGVKVNTSTAPNVKPLIEASDRWFKATDITEDPELVARSEFVDATQALADVLHNVMHAQPPRDPKFSKAFRIRRTLVELSGQYLWGDYTDSDTDARCDLEWDIHHLANELDPSYTVPEDVEPAYVANTVYPTPYTNETD